MVKTIVVPVRNFTFQKCNILSWCSNETVNQTDEGVAQVPSVTCGCTLLLDNCAANLAQTVRLALCNRLRLFGSQHATHSLSVRRLAEHWAAFQSINCDEDMLAHEGPRRE